MIEIPNFTIERELGRGGMATVYLAVQDMLGRHVALKVMLPDMARDENFRKSFLSEGKIIAKLEHRNIVHIYDFGIIDDSILYMAMEHLSGGTLKEKVAEGNVPYETAVKIIEDTAAGLAYAHNKGYIHRDIKPGNILFRGNGTAVITDFGIAKLQDTSGELTRMGYTMGTVQYMSPEQAVTTDLDHRSDIYSLGLVFYEMLTGQKAFKAESTIQAIHQHTTVAPPELPLRYSYLQPIIDKVLAKEPENRYQDIGDFVDAIKNAKEEDVTVIHKIPTAFDDDSTQILRTGQYQINKNPVNQKPEKSKKKGLFIGLATSLALIAGLAFGVTKYPEISSWLNKEDANNQVEQQATIEQNEKKQALEEQEKLKNIEEAKALAEKEQEQKEIVERENERKIAAAELQKLEAEKIERDRVLAEKIAIAKRQAEDDKKSAESKKQREIAEAELEKLKTEKAEKDKALALQIASAKKQAEEAEKARALLEQQRVATEKEKQAEEDRIKAEVQLKNIEAEKNKREEILAAQIAKAKKQAEEAQLAKDQQKFELERLAQLEKERQQKQNAINEQEKLDLALAEKNKLDAEQFKRDQLKTEQDRLDAEIAAQRKEKEAKLEKNRIAEQKRKDKANQEKKAKLALVKKKAKDAQRKKDQAKKKIAQQKKRKAALIAKKKAEALRRQQQQANSKGQIRVSATLNGRPHKTAFVVTKNGRKVQTIGGRSSANFVLPAGRYVVTTQYSGKVARANVDLQPQDIVSQSFAFSGRAPVQPAIPQKNWAHEHKQ